MVGHIVVPLWAERELPQGALGKDGVFCMFQLASKSDRKDFRVGYNSLGAYASVNHLHVHGMYASALDGQEFTRSFPIEAATQRPYVSLPSGVTVSTLSWSSAGGHHVRGLVFQGA